MSQKPDSQQANRRIVALITNEKDCASVYVDFPTADATINVPYAKIPIALYEQYYTTAAQSRAEFSYLDDQIIKKIGRQATGELRRFLASLHKYNKKRDRQAIEPNIMRAEALIRNGRGVEFYLQQDDGNERIILIKNSDELVALHFSDLAQSTYVTRYVMDMLFDIALEKLR